MATYTFYAYSASVLTYDPGSNSFRLDPNYDPQTGRIVVTLTDDDLFFDGDQGADEIGEDATQTAVISTPDGTVIASGRVYAEAYATLDDNAGRFIWLDRIEIAGVLYGYFASSPLTPGVNNPLVFSDEVDDNMPDGSGGTYDNRLTYDQVGAIPCFVAGTPILTREGELPVERITTGSLVATRDNGYQPVLWTGRTVVGPARLRADATLRPVEIAPGALGGGLPSRLLRVSPQHRILLSGPRCELMFGEPEVLCAAGYLAGQPGIGIAAPCDSVAYHHLLFAGHEIVSSAGAWTESLLFTRKAPASLGIPARRAIRRALGPDVWPEAARMCLRRWEAKALLGGHAEASVAYLAA